MKKNFTLLELLVTLSIMIILTSLLLPTLRQAKEKAQQIHCMNNLRQCNIGAFSYMQDSNSILIVYAPSQDMSWGKKFITAGYITSSSAILCCPSYPPYHFAISSSSYWWTYGANRTIPEAYKTNDSEYYVNTTKITNPSQYIFYADTIDDNTPNQQSYVFYNTASGANRRGIHLRHNNRANSCYADGHVELSGKIRLKDASILYAREKAGNLVSL